jgi:hypothetical protein
VLLAAIKLTGSPQEFHKNPRNSGVFEVCLCYGLTVEKTEKYSLDIFLGIRYALRRDTVQQTTQNQLKDSTMTSLQRCTRQATLIALCLAAASGAYAQVGSINSTIISHVFNDIAGATPSSVNAYPGLISLSESGVSKPAPGGINRDVWYFSNNGGASAYQFQTGDYFDASFQLTLAGSGTPGIDLEAGWLFSNPSGSIGGDLQSIVTAGGVVAQFGGPSYYPFSPATGGYPPAAGSSPPGGVPNYVIGQTYTMGLNYVLDPNTGMNAFQYWVNGGSGVVYALSSPGDTYFDLGPGAGPTGSPGSTLGGYFQIGNDPNNPGNGGTAIFSNIIITSVPEPSTLAFLGLGMVTLLLRRRHI